MFFVFHIFVLALKRGISFSHAAYTSRNEVYGQKLCIFHVRCADEIVNICFTIEALLRMAAMGSVRQYFSSAWNAFDFVIVALGYLSYVDLGKPATGVRALRGFRALRPLRTMKFFRPLRIVVDCFLQVCSSVRTAKACMCRCERLNIRPNSSAK